MRLLLPLCLLFITAIPSISHAEMQKAKLYAVAFTADWCASCKILEPKVEKARGKADLDNQDVLFVRLDLTDGTARHQSALLASAIGLGEFYKTNNGKTGFVLLVDGGTGEHVGKITKEMGADQIASLIQEKIQ